MTAVLGLGLSLWNAGMQGHGSGGVPAGGNGSMDFSDQDASGLLALLQPVFAGTDPQWGNLI